MVVGLADSDPLHAHTVVVGIGGVADVGWLGLDGGGAGLECDSTGRVLGTSGVYAVGDIASWPDPVSGTTFRTEHWMSARTQAAAVAAHIAGQPAPEHRPEYFWTDQFGLKIQVIGRPDLADRAVLTRPDPASVRRSSVAYLRDGRLVACALFSAARLVGRCTALVAEGAGESAALEALRG